MLAATVIGEKERAMAGSIDRARIWLRSHLKLVLMSAIAGLGVSAALALATVPDGGGAIHTCYQKAPGGGTVPTPSLGNWRVIDSDSQSCDPATEVPLNFSQQGPTGAAGPVGAAGGQGAPGGQGPAGAQDTGDECRTPVGHMTLTGNPSLSSDVCAVSRVRVGALSAAGQSQGSTEYELIRLLDGLSPKLFKAAVQGTLFKSAKIQIYKPGTTSVASTYQLSNAAIGSYKTNLGLVKPTETLTLIAVPKKGV
jgi:Type VI secretion system effector, Hcp